VKKKAPQTSKGFKGFDTKAAYILSFPRNMRVKEVLAAAKAASIALTEAYVNKVRSKDRTRKSPASTPESKGRARASRSTSPLLRTPSTRHQSKADFVRALSRDVSSADAIARAREVGIDLAASYFYTIRSQQNRAAAATYSGSKSSRSTGKGNYGLTVTFSSEDPHEQAVVEAVNTLGIAHVRTLLEKMESHSR
jgi:hypothetical protein